MGESFFGNRGFYERRAKVSDAMLGSPTYNRVFWGTHPRQYGGFAARAVGSGDGPLLEVAAGTARAAALLHVSSRRLTTFVDMSGPMLELAGSLSAMLREGKFRHESPLSAGTCSLQLAGNAMKPFWVWVCCTWFRIWARSLRGWVRSWKIVEPFIWHRSSGGSARSNDYLKLLKSHGDIAEIRTAGKLYELARDAGIGNVRVSHAGAMACLVISR